MKDSLFTKIYIPIISIVIVILFIYGYINLKDQENSYLKIMEAQTKSIVKSNILLNTEYILSDDKAQLISKSLELLKDNSVIKYLIYDKNSSFKLFISKDKFNVLDKLNDKYIQIYYNDLKYQILKGNLYDEEVFHFIYKIKISKYDWGYIHIGISLDEYYQQLENIYRKFVLITFLSLISLITIVYFFVKWITVPILDLTVFVNKITKGELNEIEIDGKDEIAQLKKDFNIMVKYLKKSKEQEKLIFQQTKMAHMTEMLNNIAHQWRQPLSVITVGVSGIKLKRDLNLLSDEDFNLNYKLIMDNAIYLTETIDIFSKYTQNENLVEMIEINRLIEDTMVLNKDFLNKNSILFELELLKNSLEIQTIPSILSQVITNILLNINKFFENKNKKRIIRIKLEENNSNLFITIEDNSGVIDETLLENIFEPYFTGNSKFKGVGIGLYLSFDMINNTLKGDLSVKNTKMGAKFTIILPKNIN